MLKLLERQQGKPDEGRKLSPFSRTSIPFLNQDLYTRKQKLRSFEAQQKFFLVPDGRFIVVLSSSFSRLTVIDVDRYFNKKPKGAKNPPLADYTASIACPGISGKFGVNISLNGDTLLMVISSSMDRYFLCPDLLVIDRLTDPVTYTHVHGVPMHKRMGWTQSKMCENRVIRVISLDKAVYIMATGGYQRGPPKEPRYVIRTSWSVSVTVEISAKKTQASIRVRDGLCSCPVVGQALRYMIICESHMFDQRI